MARCFLRLLLTSYGSADPVSDQLVNCFDLVRLHKFGAKDKTFDGDDKKPSEFPFWAAINIVCRDQSFHPIREVLESFVHDGEARAESLFTDYLGCPDDEYHREVSKLWLVAAVARIYEPGHKFDFCPVLVGPQGTGKSTFAKTLAMGYFGELNASFHDTQKLAEEMLEKWIMEMPELVSMTRSEVEPAKQFLSATSMTVRMAYDRHPTEYQRQCVFMGTTNNIDFLKDDTGNRRWWPVLVGSAEIDIAKLRREVSQIWAEAVSIYRAMRKVQPYGDLPLYLQGGAAKRAVELQEESRRPTEADTLAERIAEILNSPISDERFDSLPGSDRTPRYLDEVTPAYLIEKLGDQKLSTQLIAVALNKCGWRKSGKKKRFMGLGYASLYVPTEATAQERQNFINQKTAEDLV